MCLAELKFMPAREDAATLCFEDDTQCGPVRPGAKDEDDGAAGANAVSAARQTSQVGISQRAAALRVTSFNVARSI